jgi:serine/threonine protein kinase
MLSDAPGRYVLISLLGKGGFSEVWKCFDVHLLIEVAVKVTIHTTVLHKLVHAEQWQQQ